MNSLPDPNQLLIGALAFLRIGAMLFAMPIIGDSPTPVRVRALLAVALTVGLYPLIKPAWVPNLAADVLVIGGYIVSELIIGVVIGYLARLAFDGILMAASVVSYQMGFGTAHLFLPDFGGQIDAFTAFHRIVIMLIFFSLGLHHIFIGAIADSFRVIPGGGAHLTGPVGAIIVETTGGIIAVAMQLAAPVLVALLFTTAALGLAARTVPQLNVFVLSFPANFFVGLIVYIATLPFYPEWMSGHFEETQTHFTAALRALSG